jgi:signal transduction histidine kinase
MLTRHKLSISVAVSVAAAVVVGVVLLQAVQRVQRLARDSDLQFELSKHLAQRRLSMVEFSSYGQERARLQWETDNRLINEVLSQLEPAAAEIDLVERLRRNQKAMRAVFDRMVITAGEARNGQDSDQFESKQRLMAQFMGRSQDMSSDVLRLNQRRSRQEHEDLRNLSLLAVLLTLLSIGLVAANWLVVWRNLLRPMKHLESDAAAIAAGDLGLRTGIATGDEIGALARNFDAMTAQLEATVATLRSEIAEREKANQALAASSRELIRSNAELEQFAHLASHDLQEPLRMVVSYVQLLERRLAGTLDSDTREFMEFAVEGSLRMKHIVLDLLEYSRIGATGTALVPVNSMTALQSALAPLAPRIAATGAVVDAASLPVVMADAAQLEQLFRHLVDNALKFCPGRTPVIRIRAHSEAGRWRFSVADNGIGIAPEYHARIFRVFQRLHARREFSGTGIGLAMCKRIVEHHAGEIGVETATGGGSVFWFSLPEETPA